MYHQNGWEDPELKFVNPDGREAVYTRDFSSDHSYQIYRDPRYMGTFNYVTVTPVPTKWYDIVGAIKFGVTGTGHFFIDMLPYYIWGNTRK